MKKVNGPKSFITNYPYEGPIGYYLAMFNLDRLLKMKKLPNKFFPWLNREEILEIRDRAEILYHKIKTYM